MLAAERYIKILELINRTGSVQVDQLSAILEVSPMTVRRDLEKLQACNKIERCHGGAVIKKEIQFGSKEHDHRNEKIEIAKKCAEYVTPGSSVFLDAGTTTYEIALLIQNVENLTVLTNDLEIAALFKKTDAEIVVCGGHVNKENGRIYGYLANQMIENFHLNIGFFGAGSIDESYNVLTADVDKASFNRLIMEKCQRTFLAIDESKFTSKAMFRINNFKDYTGIITNKIYSQDEMGKMEDLGINLTFAYILSNIC